MTHPEAFGPLPNTTPEGRNEDHFQTPLQKAGTKLSATSWNLEKTPEPTPCSAGGFSRNQPATTVFFSHAKSANNSANSIFLSHEISQPASQPASRTSL